LQYALFTRDEGDFLGFYANMEDIIADNEVKTDRLSEPKGIEQATPALCLFLSPRRFSGFRHRKAL